MVSAECLAVCENPTSCQNFKRPTMLGISDSPCPEFKPWKASRLRVVVETIRGCGILKNLYINIGFA